MTKSPIGTESGKDKMKATKILKTEIDPISVSSLPTRPTAPVALGGAGYSSKELREAFDKLPLLIAERFNALLDDIDSGALAESIGTGVRDGHSLADLFRDLKNGNFASYLMINGESLATEIASLNHRISRMEGKG